MCSPIRELLIESKKKFGEKANFSYNSFVVFLFRFKGIREGSVNEFSDYWIFVKAADGMFDAYPISEWYNFLPQARYKTLDIDEAEEQFTQ